MGKSKEELIQIIHEVMGVSEGFTGNYNGDKFLILEGTHQEKELEEKTGMTLDDITQTLGVELGYSDEYSTCGECGELIYTNGYGLPDYIVYGYDYVCNDCVTLDMLLDTAQEVNFINNPKKALSNQLCTIEDLKKEGFELVDDSFEHGYYGREDSPQVVYNSLCDKYEDVLFYITSANPFETCFSVLVRGEIESDKE